MLSHAEPGLRSQPEGTWLVRKSSLAVFLFIVGIIGLHLRLSLVVGGVQLVPFYLFAFSALAMASIYRQEILTKAGAPLIILAAFILLAPVFSTAPGKSYVSRLPSLLSFLISITASIGFYVAVRRVPSDRMRRIVIWVWVTFIALAVLESVGLKPIFDSIRSVIYAGSGRGVYEAVNRDLALYGKVRPTVFATEPSFLAYTLAILNFLNHVLQPFPRSWQALAITVAMFVMSFLIAPSFTYVFFMGALLTWTFWPTTVRGFAGLLLVLSAVFSMAFLFGDELSAFVFQMLGGHTETGSFFGRILVAPSAGLKTLTTWPLLGVGIGNADAARPIIVQIWNDAGAFSLFPWFRNSLLQAQDLMSNGFWWQWMFLGLLGGSIFTAIMLWLLRALGVAYPLRTILCCWIIWYPGSAFVDAGTWIIFAIVSLTAITPPKQTEIEVVA